MIETILNLTEILFEFAVGCVYSYLSWLTNRFPGLAGLFPDLLF